MRYEPWTSLISAVRTGQLWTGLKNCWTALSSSSVLFEFGIQNLKNLCFRSVRTELWKQNVQPGPNRIRFPLNRTETVRSDHTGPVAEPNRDSSVRSYRSGSWTYSICTEQTRYIMSKSVLGETGPVFTRPNTLHRSFPRTNWLISL